MEPKKVLFITQEIEPYLPSSPLADFSKNLPAGMQTAGLELRIFTPRFGIINERRNQIHDVIRLSGINIIVNDTDHPLIVKVASMPGSRIQAYFVDNDEFFKRKSLYDPDPKYVNTNAERAAFFIRGACEAIRTLRWVPDIIHCAGWFAGFAPLYLKTIYKDDPCFAKAKVVYTAAANEQMADIGDNYRDICAFDKIDDALVAPLLESPNAEGLQKLGMLHADGVSFVAPDVASVQSLYDYACSLNKSTDIVVGMPEDPLKEEQYSVLYNSL